MGGLIVAVQKKRGIRQRYHIVIKSAVPPNEVLFWSENYANLSYAEDVARSFANRLQADLELEDYS